MFPVQLMRPRLVYRCILIHTYHQSYAPIITSCTRENRIKAQCQTLARWRNRIRTDELIRVENSYFSFRCANLEKRTFHYRRRGCGDGSQQQQHQLQGTCRRAVLMEERGFAACIVAPGRNPITLNTIETARCSAVAIVLY